MSGRDNLEVLARTANDYRPRRVAALLELVGLGGQAKRRVSGYSTGMKQRLGIAAALLGDPDLVILDEPTNGLDPAGIQEMRGFIRDLPHRHGKTVFLSSHLLTEVEQVCDRVAIIHKGEMVREGPVADLLGEGKPELHLQVSPLEAAAQTLQGSWAVVRDEGNPGWLTVSVRPEESHQIIKRLVEREVRVHQAVVRRQSLEDFFISVTQPTGNEPETPDA
jgi:ABC-2 type transport system ATP-binding protein